MDLTPSSPGSLTPRGDSEVGSGCMTARFYQSDGESREGSSDNVTTPVFPGKVDGPACGVLVS